VELPPALRQAIDRALDGVKLADLAAAAENLSRRYRAELRDGKPHLSDDLSVLAYLATRLPATYAAIRASLAAIAERRPDFAPRTLLDVGAGPSTDLWAAADCWPIEDALLIENSPVSRAFGEKLAAAAPVARVAWQSADITRALETPPRDLVTLSYVLDELPPDSLPALLERLWAATAGILLIVEPGRPAGWQRILAARDILLAAGAHIVAPCPHALACPLTPPDWCHFARRVARSRLHRLAKGGDVPWEDEKFIYLAVSREPGPVPAARVIAPPRVSTGQVTLKLCTAQGRAEQRHLTRRDGEAFRKARRVDWGDAVPDFPAGG
jgi:ribosomal protein RSM22 (predicted rRNA methylase)